MTSSTASQPGSTPPQSPDPSDILFAILSLALLLASGFVLGGLMAHPF